MTDAIWLAIIWPFAAFVAAPYIGRFIRRNVR